MQERFQSGRARIQHSIDEAGRHITQNLRQKVDAITATAKEIGITAGLVMDEEPIYPQAWGKQETVLQPQEIAYFAFGGDSGTGKGTVVAALAKRLNTPNIMIGGDLVRRFFDVTREVSIQPTGIDTAVDGLLTASLRNAVAKRGLLPRPLIVEGRRVPELLAEQRDKEEKHIANENERRRKKNEKTQEFNKVIEAENERRSKREVPLIPYLPLLDELQGPIPYTEGVCVILTADPLMQAERYAERRAKRNKRKLPQDTKAVSKIAWREWEKEQGGWPEVFNPTLGDYRGDVEKIETLDEQGNVGFTYRWKETWDPKAGNWIPVDKRKLGRREKDNTRYVKTHPELLKDHIKIYPQLEDLQTQKQFRESITDPSVKKAVTSRALYELREDIKKAGSIPSARWPYAQTLTDKKGRPIPDMVISTTYITATGDIENKDPEAIVDEILATARARGYIVHEQPRQGVLFSRNSQQDTIVD